MKYSKHNIQQNRQTIKEEKNLITLSSRRLQCKFTLEVSRSLSPQIAWRIKWKTFLTIFDIINNYLFFTRHKTLSIRHSVDSMSLICYSNGSSRPQRRRARIVRSYSLGGTNVHLPHPLQLGSLGPHESALPQTTGGIGAVWRIRQIDIQCNKRMSTPA